MQVRTDTRTAKDIRGRGYKATRQRVILLDMLRTARTPLSVEEILHVHKKIMNETTVYRILEKYIELGLARRIELQKNRTLFEAVGEHHHHLVCRVCGRIKDVDACVPKSMYETIQKKNSDFAVIEDHALEFFGICKSCSKK